MNDQLVNNITTIVDEIFKKKEEAEMKKETEAALNSAAETITQLSESLEAKDEAHQSEVASLQETITSLETQLSEIADDKKALEDEKAKFDEEKDTLTKRAEAAEEELDNIKKDQLAASRMEVLKSEGIASTNSEAQQAKVREMSEEDFASYKDELVSVREFVVKELEGQSDGENALAATEKAEADKLKKEAEKKKEVLAARLGELKEAGAEITDEDEIAKIQDMDDEVFASYKDEVVAALDSSSDDASIDPMKAIAAALNMEAKPNEDILKQYRALGAQMAENIKSRKEK
jgi:chromosome segregation ATPase